ncbi:MAG: hypothetical protein EAZ57_03390 [Cytophagales bacterium]|nr:MAG: hypothetical protein EAZ67_03855 [Cytophagales bacterium]TAF61506.1 MAG: hypothetical protein EAZ57_03390 [Cytophagales bacterium]
MFKSRHVLRIIFLSILLCCGCYFFVQAQTPQENALAQLKVAKDDRQRITFMLKLAELWHGGDNLKAVEYAQQALDLSEKIQDPECIANSYLWLSYSYSSLGKENEGYAYGMKALNFFREAGNKRQVILSLNTLAGVHSLSGNYDKAAQLWIEALGEAEILKNDTLIARLSNNMGQVYNNESRFDKALIYYERSRKIYETMQGKDFELAVINNNIATIYLNTSQLNKALEIYLKLEKAPITATKKPLLGTIYGNIAAILSEKKQYQEALNYLDKSIACFEEIDDFVRLSSHWLSKSVIYDSLGKPDEAIKALDRAKDISRYTDNKLALREVYGVYSLFYANKKDYKTAYDNLAAFVSLNDSIFTIEKNNALTEMSIRYDVEKTEQNAKVQEELVKAQQEALHEHRLVIICFACSTAIVAVLAFFMYRNIREKRRLYQDLESKSNEAVLQKDRISQQSKQITDSIRCARQIQEAILPTEAHIKSYFADAFVIYMPKDIVSGDFYWFRTVNKSRLIAVADCTGHGVPGAFMSAIANTILEDIVNQYGVLNPSQIIRLMDNSYRQLLNQDIAANNDVIDIAVCSVEVINNTEVAVEFAGASRPFVYTHQGEITVVKGDPHSLGGREGKHRPVYPTTKVKLEKGDNVYLMSDGLGDQFSPSRSKFTSRRLVDLLKGVHQLAHEQQKIQILNAIKEHRQDAMQVDDITLLGIKI